MPKGDMIEKRKLLVDGEELPGLVNISEYSDEEATVKVPGLDKNVPVGNGVRDIPEIEAIYKVTRDSTTLQFLRDWKNNKEFHNVTLIKTDRTGAEFERQLWTNVELTKVSNPAFDASSPTYAQVTVKFCPEDIRYLKAE